MKIVCASTVDGDSCSSPDVFVLPERTGLAELHAAAARWPTAVIVGAVQESLHVRAYLLRGGVNHIDYLKLSHDGVSPGTLQPPTSQTYESGEVAIAVFVCKDFQQTGLLSKVMHALRSSRATHKLVCIPADMGSEWFPNTPVRDFVGAYVALSNNLRTPTHTRRASFILDPAGNCVQQQVGHRSIHHDAA